MDGPGNGMTRDEALQLRLDNWLLQMEITELALENARLRARLRARPKRQWPWQRPKS